MASVTIAPSVLHFAPMPRHVSFKGDRDSLLDELIVASQKKAIDDSSLKERSLVPYFDDMVNPTALLPLQQKPSRKKQPQSQPTQQPAKQRKTAKQQAQAGASVNSNSKASSKQEVSAHAGQKHRRDPSSRNLPAMATNSAGGPAISSGRRSPPHKRLEQLDTASSDEVMQPVRSGLKFAGPAFTNSPMPEALPLPTTALLLKTNEAADQMRLGLLL